MRIHSLRNVITAFGIGVPSHAPGFGLSPRTDDKQLELPCVPVDAPLVFDSQPRKLRTNLERDVTVFLSLSWWSIASAVCIERCCPRSWRGDSPSPQARVECMFVCSYVVTGF